MLPRLRLVTSIAALSFALSTSAYPATLIGDSIQTLWSFPPVGTPDPTVSVSPSPFTVGAGVEATFVVEGIVFVSVDFDANSLVLAITSAPRGHAWIPATQNGPIFTVLSGNAFPDVVSATVSNAGSIAAYILNGELFVNFSDWGEIVAGDTATVTFAATDTATPLPAALPLFVSGLGVMGLLGWRRTRKTAA